MIHMARPLAALGQGEEYVRNPDAQRLYDVENDATIIGWRADCFGKLGIEPMHANALAVRRDIDRTEVERLAQAGCPSSTISAILL